MDGNGKDIGAEQSGVESSSAQDRARDGAQTQDGVFGQAEAGEVDNSTDGTDQDEAVGPLKQDGTYGQEQDEVRDQEQDEVRDQKQDDISESERTLRHEKSKSRFRFTILAIIIAVVFFCLGQDYARGGIIFGAGANDPNSVDGTPLTEVGNRVNEVAQDLDDEALYQFDVDAATKAAIEGLLATSGDKYAQYFDDRAYEEYIQYNSGSYSGIGVEIVQMGQYVFVANVYDGTPAAEAGVKPGDVFVSIDGVQQQWDTDSVLSALKREVGENVNVVWLRPTEESLTAYVNELSYLQSQAEASGGSGDSSKLTISTQLVGDQLSTQMVYSDLTIPNISSSMIGNVGYIKLDSFNSEAAGDVEDAVNSLSSQGAQGLILDLRDNGGGYVDQAVDIVSLFVEDGDVLQLKSRSSTKTTKVTGNKITDLPLVVLVNENSASASEIVTAALKDNGRATIVGTTTFGKGTVQDIVGLSYGGGIKFTIAEYLSPNGNTINGVGITPDVVVQAQDGFELGSGEDDVQLDQALQVMYQKIG